MNIQSEQVHTTIQWYEKLKKKNVKKKKKKQWAAAAIAVLVAYTAVVVLYIVVVVEMSAKCKSHCPISYICDMTDSCV